MMLRLILMLGCLSISVQGLTAETIQVYTYHNHPPFITAPDQGLTQELVKQLNQQSKGGWDFNLQVVPRRRLNAHLRDWIDGKCEQVKCRDNWMVLWVNPKWGFGKTPLETYHWSGILQDSNAIISTSTKPIKYDSPQSLLGTRFGGMGGHRYVGIDDLAKAGKLRRIDGNVERDNVIVLLAGRLDAILLPTSTIGYFMHQDPAIAPIRDQLYVAPHKHQSYMRHIMVPKRRADLADFVDTLNWNTHSWNSALEKAGIRFK